MKNQSLIYFLCLYAWILSSIGCKNNSIDTVKTTTAAPFDLTEARKSIDEKNAIFAKAFISGDSATMLNNYMKDGKMLPPNAEAAIGSAAMGKLIGEYLKFGIKEFHDETTALYGTEDNLIEEGNYLMGDGKGKILDRGKYIDVWRKVDGDWKVFSNLWNSSLPPGPCK